MTSIPAGQAEVSLSQLNELAKVYASSYASPHHITFTIEGLRSLLQQAEGVQPREPVAWQPISTAPKDGSQIILTNGVDVAQGWWEHQEPYIREQRDTEGNYIDQQEHDGFDGWLDCEGGMQPDPTGWQPLPAPPEGKE